MSFDVVASSRVEKVDASPWKHAITTGAQFGLAAMFLALVGIVNMFQQRWIIVGVLTLGYATLGLLFVLIGIIVARRGLFHSVGGKLAGATLGGAIAGTMLAILPLAMGMANLRTVFVSLEPALRKMLTFGLQGGFVGEFALINFAAVLAIIGAILQLLPDAVRRPLLGGIVGAILAGLFQELIRILLANSFVTKPIHDLLYTYTGLTLRGALIVGVVTAVAIGLLDYNRERLQPFLNPADEGKRRTVRWVWLIGGLVLVALFPLYGGNFIGQVLMMVGLFVLMGMGLNLEVGLAGLLDLGFVAFFAVGAYTTALLTADDAAALGHLSWWAAMPISVLAAIIVGVLFGVPVLKVRGDYLAVATMGLGEIVRVIVLSDAAAPLFNGAKGILQIPRPMLFGQALNSQVAMFYVTLVASLLAAYVAWRLENSRLGRAWTAIRDDEDVAQALGINLINVKLLAYGLGAAFAGLAGSIFAAMLGSIYPHSFQLIISINVLALIIVGGIGSLGGVVLGSAVLIGLPELLREFGEFRYLFYGLAIVAVTRLKPEGLWPSNAKKREMRLDQEAIEVQQRAPMAEKVA